MEFMGNDIKDIIVTLPLADGTELNCGVADAFDLAGNSYLALLPMKNQKELDYSANYMLYRVGEDGEGNPVVEYIEDDLEYTIAANYFSAKIKK